MKSKPHGNMQPVFLPGSGAPSRASLSKNRFRSSSTSGETPAALPFFAAADETVIFPTHAQIEQKNNALHYASTLISTDDGHNWAIHYRTDSDATALNNTLSLAHAQTLYGTSARVT